jgi:predicted ABC-type ATPase
MIKTIDKTKCKKRITEKSINEYIENTTLSLKTKTKPLCIINVGGPGSGKTTISKIYIKKQLKKNINNFCIINPDDILYKYYDNNTHCYAHNPSSYSSPYKTVNNLFNIAVEEKLDILYDTTGLNIKDIKSKIKILKKSNYTINVCVCILDDPSIALKRVEKRGILTGRQIDKDYFLKRYHELPKILKNYYFNELYKTIDEIIIYNTSGAKPKIEEIYN